MARETWVQSQVESYQRLKKWYLMPPCLTLSIIKVRIKGKVEQSRERSRAHPLYLGVVSYRKGSLRVPLDYINYYHYYYFFIVFIILLILLLLLLLSLLLLLHCIHYIVNIVAIIIIIIIITSSLYLLYC